MKEKFFSVQQYKTNGVLINKLIGGKKHEDCHDSAEMIGRVKSEPTNAARV